jgi:multidrug efflux pump subunit AcrB
MAKARNGTTPRRGHRALGLAGTLARVFIDSTLTPLTIGASLLVGLVSLLVALALGARSAGVVAVAIPVTVALTLATFYLYGYTLNRVTLFALIFSIGILVDVATLTVIAAIVPMAFVSGLMGPYTRPIPIGASAAMVYSLLVAFVITPWAALRLLGDRARTHRRRICWREWLQRAFPTLPHHPRTRSRSIAAMPRPTPRGGRCGSTAAS